MAILYNKQNVQIGYALLFYAPAETPYPELTLSYGTAWPTPWKHPGATNEGVSLSIEVETQSINIEESATAALVVGTNVNVTIEADLAEDTLDNMALAYGAGGQLTTYAATQTLPGYRELQLSSDLPELAIGLDMKLRNGLFRRIMVPLMNSAGTTETSFRRAEAARTYPTTFTSISDPEEIFIREVTDPVLEPTP